MADPRLRPVFYGDGQSKEMATLLDAKSAVLDIGAGAVAYKVNDGQSGFYRVRYREKDNLKELGRQIASRSLSAEDRWGIQDDLYAR